MPASRSKMVTVHNGVKPLTIVKKLDALPNYDDQITRLVMVARFNKQKDQALLVKAIAKLRQEKIPVQLSFVGEGPSAMAVEKLAKDLDVVDCVHFLGARDDVNQILRSCDVFVLISNWEGFPISILEAMRQGLPVVASDVGGVSEAVCDSVTGFLVPRGNLAKLVAALRKICLQPDIRSRLGLNGKSFYEENFTLNVMTKKIFDIYDRILGNRGVS
jgi:glycosyltransferase involved in cell wall biosynthesis